MPKKPACVRSRTLSQGYLLFAAVDFGCLGGEDAFCKFPGLGLQAALVLCEGEIHRVSYRMAVLGSRAMPCVSIWVRT